MTITLLHPAWLLLLALLPGVWFLPRRLKDGWLGSLRSLLLLCLILALARPVMVRQEAPAYHLFILDGSASVAHEAWRKASQGLRALAAALPQKEHRLLITLGARPVLKNPGLFESRLALPAAAGSSSLSAALQAAARAIPRGARGAVILASDGLATDRRWGPVLQELCARNLPLHTLRLSSVAGDIRPVAFFSLEELQVGRTARMVVEIQGQTPSLEVKLSGPNGVLARFGPAPSAGRKRLVLQFEPKTAGFLPLRVTITARGDTLLTDNSVSRTFPVQNPLAVLYLGWRMQAGRERLKQLLGRGFEMISGGLQEGSPLPSLKRFDLVILDDAPASHLPAAFQRRLLEAVENQGLGLFVCGGKAAFGPGGYRHTPVEKLLPVEFVQKEEKRDPSTALAVIIDTSGSMSGNRIRLAKEVARLAIRRLLPHDKVGIVEFYGNKHWAAPLQSAANAIAIQRALNRLDAGGGTILMPAIEEAYFGLRNVQTRYKHVLILTDAGVESGAYERIMRRMAKDGINVSTVLVGPGRHSEFLVQLSTWGHGRYYHASNRFNLPEVLLKQPSTARLPAYLPGRYPLKTRGGPGWWGQVDKERMPPLRGYVETRGRPGALVLAETRRDGHPVLATWRYGLGRVTAFTTEPLGPGTADYKNWKDFGPFLARLLWRTASQERHPFSFSLTRRGPWITLVAQARHRPTRTIPEAHLLPGNQGPPLLFREEAPGLFQARFPFAPSAPVRLLAGASGQRAGSSIRLCLDPRSDEARERQVDPLRAFDLEGAARATGGSHLDLAGLGGRQQKTGGGTRPLSLLLLWPWCLLLALVLYLTEIAYRRSPYRRFRE